MSGRLEQKVAIVTGAASGFGRATAVRFGLEGAKVIVSDLDESQAKEVVGEIVANGSEADLLVGDVSDSQVADALAALALDRFGRLDILVNNAGVSQSIGFQDSWDLSDDAYDRLIKNNLRSVYVCSRAALRNMVAVNSGAIVNVASIAAFANTGGAPYSAAKGGMLAYTRNVAAQIAPHGIRINCVSPGFMRTPMSLGLRQGLSLEQQEERMKLFASFNPMGRPGAVEDISNAILFFASDEANYVTGQNLFVDGGFLVRG